MTTPRRRVRPDRTARRRLSIAGTGVLAASAASVAFADWTNMGGNAGRNGLTDAIGPVTPTVLWDGVDTSVIAWHPVVDADTVYVVRQTGFPPGGEPNGSPIFAYDLADGTERWRADLPYVDGDWTTWIAGVANGRLFASRAGNGSSVSAPLYALDTATGDVIWESSDLISAGAYDGVVFAPNGDPVIGSFRSITRLSWETGETVWEVERTCSVSGTCGVAIGNGRVYGVDAVVGGHKVFSYDLADGTEGPASPRMMGFTIQNTPMVGPDGTIYVPRTQNNPTTDFFYAFQDAGPLIVTKWRVPNAWSTRSEHAVGPDGSVYMMLPGDEFVRLDPDTGDVLDSAGVLEGFSSPRLAIDADGRVYLSNGAFPTGRLYAFEADLTPLWDEGVTNINIGGPALAADGTLVVVGNGTTVRAYAGGGSRPSCPGDVDGDGATDFPDLLALLAAWGPCTKGCPEDVSGDDLVGLDDLLIVLADWECSS